MLMRLTVSILALSIIGVSSASGMELVWSNGSTNLNFAETRQCTLLVKATGSVVPLPEEWRLVYVTNGLFDPISPVVAPAPSGIADVCSRRERHAAIDQVSHADTAVHCAAQGSLGRPSLAMPSRFLVVRRRNWRSYPSLRMALPVPRWRER